MADEEQRPPPPARNKSSRGFTMLQGVSAFLALLVLLVLIVGEAFGFSHFPKEAYILVLIVGVFIFNLNVADILNKD